MTDGRTDGASVYSGPAPPSLPFAGRHRCGSLAAARGPPCSSAIVTTAMQPEAAWTDERGGGHESHASGRRPSPSPPPCSLQHRLLHHHLHDFPFGGLFSIFFSSSNIPPLLSTVLAPDKRWGAEAPSAPLHSLKNYRLLQTPRALSRVSTVGPLVHPRRRETPALIASRPCPACVYACALVENATIKRKTHVGSDRSPSARDPTTRDSAIRKIRIALPRR